MGGRTGFHAHQARRQRREELQNFRSTKLSANKLLARHPNGVNLKDIFRQIQTIVVI